MTIKTICSTLLTTHKWKTLRRQDDLQSYNLASSRESDCRREHLEYCSESMKPNKKTEYTLFQTKISAPTVCTDSNLRYSWNHILQWTYTVPREQKGCQSTWMNHSETHNINLLAGWRIVRVLHAEPENKTLGLCHSTNVSQEENTPGTQERAQTSSFISLYLQSESLRVRIFYMVQA